MNWYENHVLLFAVTFGLAAGSGLAQLLISDRELTPRLIAGNMLFQGFVGLAVVGTKLSWTDMTAGSVYGTIAIAISLSLLGVKAADIFTYLAKLSKLRIDKNDDGKPE